MPLELLVERGERPLREPAVTDEAGSGAESAGDGQEKAERRPRLAAVELGIGDGVVAAGRGPRDGVHAEPQPRPCDARAERAEAACGRVDVRRGGGAVDVGRVIRECGAEKDAVSLRL